MNYCTSPNRAYLAVANAFAQICSANLRKLQIRSELCTKERAKIRRNQYETMV
jgi:hypothetical protein